MLNKFGFPLFYWHLEISSKCALACPRCPRTGEENKKKYNITEISLESVQKIFNRDFLHQEVNRILFCGGQGDPIYHSQFHEIIRYLKQTKPELELLIVTNGSHRTQVWWQKLALELNEYDRIVFSVDGWDQQSNEIYRVGSKFESILLGVREMVKSRATVQWSTIVFAFNQDRIKNIEEMARALGVNYFNITLSTKFGSPWLNSSGIDPLEPRIDFRSRFVSYQKFQNHLNSKMEKRGNFAEIVRNRMDLASNATNNIMPRCMIGERGMYIDASGILYPCSWISHPHDMPLAPGQKNLWLDNRSKFNVYERPLEEVLNDPIWESLFKSWENDAKMYSVCKAKCKMTPVENMTRGSFDASILLSSEKRP